MDIFVQAANLISTIFYRFSNFLSSCEFGGINLLQVLVFSFLFTAIFIFVKKVCL